MGRSKQMSFRFIDTTTDVGGGFPAFPLATVPLVNHGQASQGPPKKKRDFSKPKPETVSRCCLKCDDRFKAPGRFVRLCPRCRRQAEGIYAE